MTLPILLTTAILAYFIYAAHVLDLHKPALEALCKPIGDWFGEAGNPVTAVLWTVIGILLLATWFGPEDSIFYNLQGEITGMAFTVIVIDWLVGYRNGQQEKKRILHQLSSRSNDFALDAARIIVEEGWHKDGSLKWLQLTRADLRNVELSGACLEGSVLHFSLLTNALLNNTNLQSTILVDAQLDGACLFFTNLSNAYLMRANLCGANLLGANLTNTELTGATYNNLTAFPDGFDHVAAGAIFVED